MHKIRGEYGDLTREPSYRHIVKMEDGHIDLKHQTVVIIDDMISTGSTIIRAIDSLKKRGVRDICVAATHGLFLGDSGEKLAKLTKSLIASDSIPNPYSIALTEKLVSEAVLPDWLKR